MKKQANMTGMVIVIFVILSYVITVILQRMFNHSYLMFNVIYITVGSLKITSKLDISRNKVNLE